ncbi:MAG: methyltransferase, TIGR04325 family [Leptolyngbyaceae cyanobacterium T60_A2020_046]|nr:methyltransferase, TIGR04325 family [Leptolyngbyaceae cyanobacterium T60_A2020_046]
MNQLKRHLKEFIPPAFFRIREYLREGSFFGFSGDYPTWEAAVKVSTSWNSDTVFGRVRKAALKVKQGEAVYERDSVLFDQVHYSWPLLSGLLRAALAHGGKLHVLDFGGGLGSSYYQNRQMLKPVSDLQWCIVEQGKFVEIGQAEFQDHELKFFATVEECLDQIPSIHVLLLSAVLQALESPHEFLEKFVRLGIQTILIDRTSFVLSDRTDRIVVQTVPPSIYPQTSFPAWFFNRETFLSHFSGKYQLVAEFDTPDSAAVIHDGIHRGLIFERLTEC